MTIKGLDTCSANSNTLLKCDTNSIRHDVLLTVNPMPTITCTCTCEKIEKDAMIQTCHFHKCQ